MSYSSMGNTQINPIIEWESTKWKKVKGTIAMSIANNKPAYLSYDKTSTYKSNETFKIIMESPEEKTDVMVFIIKKGWYIPLQLEIQRVTFSIIERTDNLIIGEYISLVPDDKGTFRITLDYNSEFYTLLPF